MMYWNDGGWSWWMVLPMTLSMVAFWGLVIWAIVALIRPDALTRNRAPAPGEGAVATPEERLAHRLAEGDIDVPEYEQRRDAMRRSTHPGGVGS